jgi:hypothetical protein
VWRRSCEVAFPCGGVCVRWHSRAAVFTCGVVLVGRRLRRRFRVVSIWRRSNFLSNPRRRPLCLSSMEKEISQGVYFTEYSTNTHTSFNFSPSQEKLEVSFILSTELEYLHCSVVVIVVVIAVIVIVIVDESALVCFSWPR